MAHTLTACERATVYPWPTKAACICVKARLNWHTGPYLDRMARYAQAKISNSGLRLDTWVVAHTLSACESATVYPWLTKAACICVKARLNWSVGIQVHIWIKWRVMPRPKLVTRVYAWIHIWGPSVHPKNKAKVSLNDNSDLQLNKKRIRSWRVSDWAWQKNW